jgi:hypothetical protein
MQEKAVFELITKMKAELLSDVSEWLGSEIPDEETEDYETWQEWLQEIEEIRSFADIYWYLDAKRKDVDDFFESWDVEFDLASRSCRVR